MRAFIAIEISAAIKGMLTRVESHLKYSGADVKWVKPEIIHLTLKFLDEITDKKAEEVKVILDSISSKMIHFELTVKDIGAFPEIENPRVIWIGLDKGASETVSLAALVDEELFKVGFIREERPFSPHLTIGRVKSSLNMEKLKAKMMSAASDFPLSGISPHKVSSMALFQSTLTPQGSVYTKLHEARFAA